MSSCVIINSITNIVLTRLCLKITSPVASTTFAAGQQETITWQDDGMTPSLTSFGPALIGIYVGNANQQVSYYPKVHEKVF